ncbi:alpha-glucan family phosphorylase [Deinococcus peraridilitoris]|uniref:Alpha-glucan phosphorylase n=1 Tax=Deinococcus peraridilitoris (strain DSM 19664 / LMG 22246 / CIP 109416 / KR-200) TaxID=937777 RepID=K9ZZ00_DEIPD|nr:alpha-glucan family phosphorylase [Deinococcus peraridilitoris]AFZ65985.1 alpha-glucan phosphorylase [Deinococcus peraridilitoris DSM 19664]
MNVLGKVTVLPKLPAELRRLEELAYNLYWSWTPHAQALYQDLDPALWERFNHNPLRVLLEVAQSRLDELARDSRYLARVRRVLADFDAYLQAPTTWAKHNAAELGQIAYFSMEYGFYESLPIYSGGLGILAGDHCKSASDLGLPFAAVGLLFHQGYFRQMINKDGWQEEAYDELDLTTLPIKPARTPEGKEVRLAVPVAGRDVHIRVWTLLVGRIPVYLLDTNVPENSEADRALTARLYGPGQDLRIQQELVLGVGGVRALRQLGVNATVFHMNEGHAAFLGLERIRELVQGGLDFASAVEAVASGTIFTTHTPVPAGNDAFPLDLVGRYLGDWPAQLGTSWEAMTELARHDQPWGQTFSMTVLALRLSRAANGVSELHGEVSRKMWNFLYPGASEDEVPVGHVTNGAHTLTFLAQKLRDLYASVLPEDWQERIEDQAMWEAAIPGIPDENLVAALRDLKLDMIQFVRGRLQEQLRRNGASAADIKAAGSVLSPEALTIGFARRFATYKRATLLFRDRARLSAILNDPARPVQFVFAGKAHPADNPGKAFIQEIYRMSQEAEFRGKIVILENYDMNVARHLVQGVDIWLNNPRRPLEASGTSGMKASINGALNFSILDGWWRESFDGTNGYAIGDEREFSSLDVQDDADSFSLYETLEDQIVPLYYRRDERGFNHGWLEKVRRAIITVAPQFSMQRQVIDYTQKYYLPLSARAQQVWANDFALARELAAWKRYVLEQWPNTTIQASADVPATAEPGQTLKVRAQVNAANLSPRDVRVEAILEREGQRERVVLSHGGNGSYEGEIALSNSGLYTVSARMLPSRPELAGELELGLIKWA